jgi:gamma-glutamyltranspeptidase/glutathione hydrolase
MEADLDRPARAPSPQRLSRRRLVCLSSMLLLVAGCAGLAPRAAAPPAMPAAADIAPEAATGSSRMRPPGGWVFAREAVAAAHPLAAEAGAHVLAQGGNAVDAAVAVQAVLGLVEPQSSGIGGGAFLLFTDGQGRVEAWDGRETAPAAADERLFLKPEDGKPLDFAAAVAGGRSVGVPGALRMLEQAHRRHGRLPWARLFEPAIERAEQGFAVGARLHGLLAADALLRRDATAAAYFYDAQGQPWPVGHRLRNPEYAALLRDVAARGSAALHDDGPWARAVVRSVREHAANPGRLALDDLRGYQPREREPLCHDFRAWRICGMPPPSSGAIAIGQILGMLEWLDARRPGVLGRIVPGAPPPPEFLHAYAEAAKLAFADRALYVADPDFVTAPGGSWRNMVDPLYLQGRAALIGERAQARAAAGRPLPRVMSQAEGGEPLAWAPDRSPELPATSHVSIVDAEGRAVAMTTTIEAQFGARLMVNRGAGLAGGFLLNNQLTDFSFVPEEGGLKVANRVEPGKRPRSSMSPTLVFERASGRLLATLGSPGGAPIIHYTAKVLLATLLYGLDVQQAIELPNFANLNGPTLLEAGRFPPATLEALRARGHELREVDLTSGLHAVERRADGRWAGGADPRREGVVRGR